MIVGDLRDEITPTTKTNEILMQAMVDKRFYLLVEGATDFRLFNQILPIEEWEVEFLDGKQNVAKCIQELTLQGIDRVSAVLDSDPLDPWSAEGQIFYSQLADLDADLFAIEGMIDRIVSSNSQLRDQMILAKTGHSSWRDIVVRLVEPWTAARKYMADNASGISMREFPIHMLGDSATLSLKSSELEKLLVRKSQGGLYSKGFADIVNTGSGADLEQFHNGHHIAAAVAWVLSEVLSGTKIKANTVEDFARTAVTIEEIQSLTVISELENWAHNKGKCIWPVKLCNHQAD